MKIIDAATGWFEIVKVPTFYLDEVTGGNDDYIGKFILQGKLVIK